MRAGTNMSRRGGRWLAIAAFVCALGGARAEAQLGQLVSPGELTAPHAELEGLRNCEKCHEPGQGTPAAKCLACHKPVAERIAARRGVHRDVTTECASCHVEHTGRGGELRPFDTHGFDHALDAGYPLDGKHAAVAGDCAKCHKARSFLTAKTTCQTCHEDVHKAALGASCERCHSTRDAFKDARMGFDHATAAFPLLGAHQRVACEKCHTDVTTFKNVAFAACGSCHRDPHGSDFGATCARCHGNETWRTTKVDHQQTDFPLEGLHARVACAACHKQPAMDVKPPSATCATCHADPHRGTFTKDCGACHTVRGFDAAAPFDHAAIGYPLVDEHAGLACEKCHKPAARPSGARSAAPARAMPALDFKGLKQACASCHADVHRGELGAECATCHTPKTFGVTSFAHHGPAGFYAGQHAGLACAKCHVPATLERPVRTTEPVFNVRFKAAKTACASCHEDVHLGQVGPDCETCHTVAAPRFEPVKFAHDTTAFALTGKHVPLACVACHKKETGAFPAGQGTAVRLAGVGMQCVSCHADVHRGQIALRCEDCHSTTTFALKGYRHRNRALADFFVGAHAAAACDQCHERTVAPVADGPPTMNFGVTATCTSCHTDPHRGAMGSDCIRCHKPLAPAERIAS